MQLAQQLYEGVPLEDASTPVALITYMRTDSLRLSDTALNQAREFIHKNFDKEYLPATANHLCKSKSKRRHYARCARSNSPHRCVYYT